MEEPVFFATEAKRNVHALIDEVKEGPWFTHPDFVTDGEGRRPDHPEYDPTTLMIPKEDYKHMTPGM